MQMSDETRRRTVYVAAAAVVVGIAAASWRQPLASAGHTVLAGVDAASAEAAHSSADGAEDGSSADAAQPKYQEYTIQDGDTVESIAQAFGLQSSSILYTNGLSEGDVLQVGDTLRIPAVDGVAYEIQSGDTLWDIALDFGVSEDDVIKANPDLDPEAIHPGQIVLVPGGEPTYRRQVASRGGEVDRDARGVSGSLSYWPTWGTISDYFGWRIHPVYGTEAFHDGLDISVPYGTPVVAAYDGYVTMTEYHGGYGYTVRIDHGGGISTDYCHLSEFDVQLGDWVNAGEVIAYSGNSGVSTGPHLHFMVRVGGSAVDPLGWLP